MNCNLILARRSLLPTIVSYFLPQPSVNIFLLIVKAVLITITFLGDCAILCTSTVKDLGVLISHDLTWSPNIAQIVSNASFCFYRVLKTFSSKNIWTLMKAFVTYVRPKLEYSTSVWSPHLKSNIQSIESVQKVFIRKACICCNIPFSSCCDRLYKLNLKSLEY